MTQPYLQWMYLSLLVLFLHFTLVSVICVARSKKEWGWAVRQLYSTFSQPLSNQHQGKLNSVKLLLDVSFNGHVWITWFPFNCCFCTHCETETEGSECPFIYSWQDDFLETTLEVPIKDWSTPKNNTTWHNRPFQDKRCENWSHLLFEVLELWG